MYQFVERETNHKDEYGNKQTKYEIHQEWRESVVDSQSFNHH